MARRRQRRRFEPPSAGAEAIAKLGEAIAEHFGVPATEVRYGLGAAGRRAVGGRAVAAGRAQHLARHDARASGDRPESLVAADNMAAAHSQPSRHSGRVAAAPAHSRDGSERTRVAGDRASTHFSLLHCGQ